MTEAGDGGGTVADISLAEWDWVMEYTKRKPRRKYIHHLASAEDADEFEDNAGGPGVATCGIKSEWWSIPGLFTRMGADRCPTCCNALGYPHGVGSPKNDDACRSILETRLAALAALHPQGEP